MNKLSYIVVFILLILSACKDANQIHLESIIDEFKYLKNNNLLEKEYLDKLKASFEDLSYSQSFTMSVTSLYYLSEISIIENKYEEAHDFIKKAYLISHADSIYQQINKINLLLNPVDTLNLLSKDDNENEVLKIFEIGRNKIKKLYENKDYDGAISQTTLLIEVLKNLNDEKLIKVELSQLFQDLAIFYSQKNDIENAKESIQKAILLNANAENMEIQKLINNK